MMTSIRGAIKLPAREISPIVPFIRKNNRNAVMITAFDDFSDFPTNNGINPTVTVTTVFKRICR